MNCTRRFLLTLVFCVSSAAFCSAQPISKWVRTYNANGGFDTANSIQATSDFGYIIAGSTSDAGNGAADFSLLKLDSSGNIQWQKAYGGSDWDEGIAVQQTSDGGYIFLGRTVTYGAGKLDFMVLKLDSSGNILWQKTIGGSENEWPGCIKQTADGGYLIGGQTGSVTQFAGYAWLVKLDASGNIVFQKKYSDAGNDFLSSIEQTTDGGFITTGLIVGGMIWVAKLDSSAGIEWQKTYDGPGYDSGTSIKPTSDGGYVVTGATYSSGAGMADVFVMKLDSNGNPAWKKHTVDPIMTLHQRS